MDDLIRSIVFDPLHADDEQFLTREWLVTNGLGGYASGTIAGVATRRYHGLLIASLPAPLGRMLMFAQVTEQIRLPNGTVVRLGGSQTAGAPPTLYGANYLREFRLEMGLPVWRYEIEDFVIEKKIVFPFHQNTVHVTYSLRGGVGPLRLKLMPSVHFRPHDAAVSTPLPENFILKSLDDRYELLATEDAPPLRLTLRGERTAMTVERRRFPQMLYRVEESRGYDCAGDLWTPGYFRTDLDVDCDATLTASTESWEAIQALMPDAAWQIEQQRRRRLIAVADPAARSGFPAELVIAADQFLIRPAGRVEDEARARAADDEARTVIAGYHWFTDWGRDTMISLEGLTLTTGRHHEAGYILRTFAQYIRDGLIPNLFPEGEKEGLYHTADATLWFFHALDRYLAATGDWHTLEQLLPKLQEVVRCHQAGTHFGIRIDPSDGLLRQGQAGYQLTWMDAKVGDWVVTPRRGKAVEINALWYNALCLLAGWLRRGGDERAAGELAAQAERMQRSFNERFWFGEGNYLYDIIDGETGDDAACRPNQLLAISLPNPVLDPRHWTAVLDVVRERLLTPMGLRTLAPGHPDYKAIYFGDLRARDAAYHQGTVWAWLVGPLIDAWLKVYPNDKAGARVCLEGFRDHVNEAAIGTISEIFDAEAPYYPRGCIAQAWSVAEVLRAWVKTAE